MPGLYRIEASYGEPPLIGALFLGWDQTRAPYRTFLASPSEDSIGILGPTRMGKTSGVLIPQAMTWQGSLISASTKRDVLNMTRGRRLEISVQREGDVYAYAPTEQASDIGGVRIIHWSPIDGCEDPTICELRVLKLLATDEKDRGDIFFRQAAGTVLRAYFHAAALARLGMSTVKDWTDRAEIEQAVRILSYYGTTSPAATQYASALQAIGKQAVETRSGTF